MKNKIMVIDDEGKKVVYHPLLKVLSEDGEYIIYTLNEKNKNGDTVCYVSAYNFENGQQVLKAVDEDNMLEFMDSILIHVQNLMNKKESS